ncbi:hypothetical protein PSTT_03987 [Puccinia striiformis]|uniref:Tet-like 2OG-Fe(II) oxygenase domain-containing protein n=1 Tax=Puccinia striiformis TaxID=27350 RepID=A0A2S4VUA7_9BASI|nr:hypothetical protein PSTT_03987 [Puccinia striiformis]
MAKVDDEARDSWKNVNTEAIKKNQEAFDQHVQDNKASEILWKLFQPIGNVALLANQQFMVEHNLPAFSDSQLPGTNSDSSKDFFSTNLTFTSNGFFNHPHKISATNPSYLLHSSLLFRLRNPPAN